MKGEAGLSLPCGCAYALNDPQVDLEGLPLL